MWATEARTSQTPRLPPSHNLPWVLLPAWYDHARMEGTKWHGVTWHARKRTFDARRWSVIKEAWNAWKGTCRTAAMF